MRDHCASKSVRHNRAVCYGIFCGVFGNRTRITGLKFTKKSKNGLGLRSNPLSTKSA